MINNNNNFNNHNINSHKIKLNNNANNFNGFGNSLLLNNKVIPVSTTANYDCQLLNDINEVSNNPIGLLFKNGPVVNKPLHLNNGAESREHDTSNMTLLHQNKTSLINKNIIYNPIITPVGIKKPNITNSKLVNQSSPIKFDLAKKLELANRLLSNSSLLLNCVQLINFINFYFDEEGDENMSPCNEEEDDEEKSGMRQAFTSSSSSFSSHNSNQIESSSKFSNEFSKLITTCFPCIVCSMKFTFDQTFHLHLNRRSVLIRIFCVKCNTYKTFYNKCKLLYHVYSHKMNLFDPIYKSIKIESLPIDRLNVAKEKYVDFDAIFLMNNKNMKPIAIDCSPTLNFSQDDHFISNLMINNGFQINENDSIQIKLFLKRLLINKFLLYKCVICDALFFDLKELRQHYVKSQRLELGYSKPQVSVNSSQQQQQQAKPSNLSRYNFKMLKQKYFDSFNKNVFKFMLSANESTNCKKKSGSPVNPNNANDAFVNLLNLFSHRKLQFSTRCSTLASMNLINNNFKIYDNSITNKFYLLSRLTSNNNKMSNVLICPECGLTFDAKNEVDNFRLHLIHECFFTIKYDCTQIKCPAINCTGIFDTIQDTIIHWSTQHLIKQHQCDICDKIGIQYIFQESKATRNNHDNILVRDEEIIREVNSSPTSSMSPPDRKELGIKPSQIMIINNHSNTSEPILSQNLISSINQHFDENHPNQQVSLKLVYKCLCKTVTRLYEDKNPGEEVEETGECVFSVWKLCQKHIVSLLAKSITSFNCLLCSKLIPNERYQLHLKHVHNLEKICICPTCGVLKDESSLHNHLLKVHKDLYYNSSNDSTCCYFRAIKNPNEHRKSSVSATNDIATTQAQQKSPQLPSDFSIYQCVNCRLSFTSKTTFSHNCWNIIDETSNQSSSNMANMPITNSSNYFSPIYLKFNLTKLFEQRLALISSTSSSNDKSKANVSNSNCKSQINNCYEQSNIHMVNSSNKKMKMSNETCSSSTISIDE